MLPGITSVATVIPNIVTVTGAQDYTQYKPTGLDNGTIIDASAATWIVANSRGDPDTVGCDTGSLPINRNPFAVYNSPNVRVTGGVVNGEVPQNTEWTNTKNDLNTLASCNSIGIHFRDCGPLVIEHWEVNNCWDGIGCGPNDDGFLVDRCHVWNAFDDAIGNTDWMGGTIRDCLLDGVFSGISMHNSTLTDNNSSRLLSVDGVLMRLKKYLYENQFSHTGPFKITDDTTSQNNTPRISITNSVIAVEDPNHMAFSRLTRAWNITTTSSNNYFLNLSDDPLPGNYPKSFGSLGGGDWVGFTVLEGQPARDYWDAAKAAWLAS